MGTIKNRKMKKTIKRIIILLIIFVICFGVTRVVLDKWKILESFIFLQQLSGNDTDFFIKIKNGVNLVWSFLVANGINLLKLYLDNKKECQKGVSRISILINDVTCLRKTKRKKESVEVVVGEGKYFIYILSVLKNVGDNLIVECNINDKKIERCPVERNSCLDFCFRVCKGENQRFRKSYKIRVKFRDDKDLCYMKRYRLKICEKKQSAWIIPLGKQKRRGYKKWLL